MPTDHEQRNNTELSPLETTMSEAFDRLFDGVVDDQERDTILDVTSRFDDPDMIAGFRKQHGKHLAPESLFFLEMSEAVKRSKTK